MSEKLRILMLEDNPTDAELAARELYKAGLVYTSRRVETREGFVKELEDFSPDLILSDYSLPTFDGLAALELWRERCPDIPFILVSAALGEERAIEALKHGATDYVLKHRLERLGPVAKRALQEAAERRERKRAEEEVREREERFRQLAENIREVFFLQPIDFSRAIYISPAYEQVWGRPVEEMYRNAMAWTEAVHPDDRARVLAALERLEMGFNLECRIVRPDGAVRWIHARAFPIRDKSGEIYRLAGIAEDISKRKEAELKLEQSEGQYRILFDQNPLPIWVFADETLAFLAVNDAAVRHYGYARDEFLSMTAADIRPAKGMRS